MLLLPLRYIIVVFIGFFFWYVIVNIILFFLSCIQFLLCEKTNITQRIKVRVGDIVEWSLPQLHIKIQEMDISEIEVKKWRYNSFTVLQCHQTCVVTLYFDLGNFGNDLYLATNSIVNFFFSCELSPSTLTLFI